MIGVTIRHCSTCGDERPFEPPPCADGHGDLCPELSCVDCGAALLVAALLEPLEPSQPEPAERPDVSSRAA